MEFSKRWKLGELKKQIHSLYNECLTDFLREKHGVLHFIPWKDYLACTLKTAGVAVAIIDYMFLENKSTKATAIYLHAKKSLDKQETCCIFPVIENKITDITDLVVKQLCYLHLAEVTRGMKYKTLKERTHSKWIEYDEYGLVKLFGQSIARELQSQELKIRNDFRIIDTEN